MDHKRPLPTTILSVIMILMGIITLVGGLLQTSKGNAPEIILASGVRVLAIVSGIFMLTGRQWARWLCIAWFTYHVVLSIWHTRFELIMHCLLLAVACIILFTPSARAYFRSNLKEEN
jgi:hypothetical protein